MHSKDVVEAVVDAMTGEVGQACADLADVSGVGQRAIASRIEKLNALEEKKTEYETLIGRKLEGLHEQLETLRASLSVAMLQNQEVQSG
jgi:NADPH-dependent curcumin reductase CurA